MFTMFSYLSDFPEDIEPIPVDLGTSTISGPILHDDEEGGTAVESTTENGAMTEGADDLQPISDAMPPAAVESIDGT